VFTNVNKADKPIASKAPRNNAETADFNKVLRPMMDARPIPIIGDIRGAINIAPIMTAGELVINPNVAILEDKITNKK